MTRHAEPKVVAKSSAWRRGFAWFLVLATVTIISHGCHGDDIDHEPAVKYEK